MTANLPAVSLIYGLTTIAFRSTWSARGTDDSIESFNGSLRDECLNLHWFAKIPEPRRLIEASRVDYNVSRPYMALRVTIMPETLGSPKVPSSP